MGNRSSRSSNPPGGVSVETIQASVYEQDQQSARNTYEQHRQSARSTYGILSNEAPENLHEQSILNLRLEMELNDHMLKLLYWKGGANAIRTELTARYPSPMHFYKIGRIFYKQKVIRILCRLIDLPTVNAKAINRHFIIKDLYKGKYTFPF